MSRENIRTTPAPMRNKPFDQNIRNDNVPAAITSVPEVKNEDFQTWLNEVYDVSKITPNDIKLFWEAFSYKGFNRDDVLKQLYSVVKDKKIILELVIVGAIAGPQRGSNMKLSNGRTAIEMGIPASGRQGKKDLTLNKITAATADLAAWFLKQMKAPKRINVELPGWLQFPSAGSIILPPNYREAHIEFSKRFSKLIGGDFNESIYMQMSNNAYLDPKLKLFDPP
jgi:hypothetical protein